MKSHQAAYSAAKEYAKVHNEMDEFEEDMLGYIDRLHDQGKIQEVPNDFFSPAPAPRGSPYWVALTGEEWYVWDKYGQNKLQGPFSKKKEALRSVGAETSTYKDTGVYYLSEEEMYVARENAFNNWR